MSPGVEVRWTDRTISAVDNIGSFVYIGFGAFATGSAVFVAGSDFVAGGSNTLTTLAMTPPLSSSLPTPASFTASSPFFFAADALLLP